MIAVLSFGVIAHASSEKEKPAQWLESHFKKDGIPPFSFHYDGRISKNIIKKWNFESQEINIDSNRVQHIYTYNDPESALQIQVESLEYKDFNAVEWLLRIKNNSDKPSPIIENIQALDTDFISATTSKYVLHHSFGSDVTREDFAPVHTPFRSVESIRFTPNGGRPSDIEAFPFFNLENRPFGGTMLAVGWTGHWAAEFSRVDEKTVNVRIGMAHTHLKLHPHEEIRTPRILLMFWDGDDYLIGQNELRKMILAHYSPRKEGGTVRLPLSFSVHGTYVFNDTTEKNMVELSSIAADRFKNIGFEYFWIDAGWYKGGWPDGVGNFYPDPVRYPNGLGPVGRAAAENGYKFLLWIEPERVHVGTEMYDKHQKWVLKDIRNLNNGLLNLGNEKTRIWLTDKISEIIETGGISIYRQDFNIDPFKFWVDTPNRQGMAEIRYVEGLYKFWDELLKRHPGLVIDNCASGGRRLDLETVSRSVALWRTDYADGSDPFMADGFQSQTYGLSFWLPTTSTGTGTLDKYVFRSAMNNGIVISWNPKNPDFPIKKAEELIGEFKRARDFYFGDYYPLTSYSSSTDVWMAYQFHKEDTNSGMVLAFRREENRDSKIVVRLKGLSPNAKYELDYSGRNMKKILSGKDLMDSLTITLEKPRDSELIFYKKI